MLISIYSDQYAYSFNMSSLEQKVEYSSHVNRQPRQLINTHSMDMIALLVCDEAWLLFCISYVLFSRSRSHCIESALVRCDYRTNRVWSPLTLMRSSFGCCSQIQHRIRFRPSRSHCESSRAHYSIRMCKPLRHGLRAQFETAAVQRTCVCNYSFRPAARFDGRYRISKQCNMRLVVVCWPKSCCE